MKALNSFDTIIEMVALGLGSSIVPRRAVRLHGRRRQVVEIELKKSLARRIGVYCPKAAKPTPAITQFVESILFGWRRPEPES